MADAPLSTQALWAVLLTYAVPLPEAIDLSYTSLSIP